MNAISPRSLRVLGAVAILAAALSTGCAATGAAVSGAAGASRVAAPNLAAPPGYQRVGAFVPTLSSPCTRS